MRKELSESSGKLAALLRELPQYRSILDVLSGATFALIRAEQLQYKDRDGILSDTYLDNLRRRLQRMATGTMPQKHGWLAGFYFNSGIQRLAAAGEQLDGILTRMARRNVNATKATVHLALANLVRQEINRFKHDETGLESGRKISFSSAIQALEEIINTLEIYKEDLRRTTPSARKRRK